MRNCLPGFAGHLLLAFLSLAVAACSPNTSDRDIVWVTPAEAQELGTVKGFSLARSKTVVYVDPRSRAEYAAGHIPGALMIPFAELREGAAGQLRGYDIVVVYDSDYDGVEARSMSKRLIEIDEWTVYTLTGGLRAWEKSGFGVEYGLPAGESGATAPGAEAVPEAIPKPVYGRPKN